MQEAMKKLQNNFTTPEQSKRLLELGVPADSADCIARILDNGIDLYRGSFPEFLKGDVRISVINERHTYTKVTTLKDGECWLDEPYPCWSVGRLIEIYEICTQTKFNRIQQTDDLVYLSPIEDVMMQIEHNACGFYDNTKWEINLLNKWTMTTEELKQLQSMLEDAKYSVQQLQNYYGKVMDDDNDAHQEGYGLLTTADYALDDFQDKLSDFSKLDE